MPRDDNADPAHQKVADLSPEQAQSYSREIASSLASMISWADSEWYGSPAAPVIDEASNTATKGGHLSSAAHAILGSKAGTQHLLHPTLVQAHAASEHPWLAKLIPSLESMASYEHLGNFVMTRGENPQKFWESMPIYVRLGMHLVFCTLHDTVSISYIEDQLSKQSIKSGVQFDSQEGAQDRISSFIKTYRLESTLDELLEPDPKKYKTFNEFFTRPLKPGARPVDGPNDPSIITSAADCRLTCYNTVKSATTFWIKSRKFNLESLIADKSISDLPEFKDEASLAIFRLAPSDFHRFSSPVAGRIVSCKKLPGQYYTVNPQAVNMDVPVFTANRRDVALLHMKKPDGTEIPIVFVAVGALLVGSIVWTAKEGDAVEKGQELGYFAYGGSTNIAIFPKGTMEFDKDLVDNSAHPETPIETQVKCGHQIGRFHF